MPSGTGSPLMDPGASPVPWVASTDTSEPSHEPAGRGVWHVTLPAVGAEDTLARLRRHGTAVVLSAPDGTRLDRWGPIPALPLMRRVKDQFDPGHRLSPGRFAGGI